LTRIKCDNVNIENQSILISTEKDFKEGTEWQKQRTSILEAAKREAQNIINAASLKSEEMINQAVEEANSQRDSIKENARQEGYQDGYNAGYQDGTNKITEEMQDKVKNVDNFAQCTFEIKKRIIKSAHRDIIELVRMISDKVCHKRYENDDEIFEEMTKGAIALLKDKESVNIIVNPKMAQKLWEISENFKQEIHGLENIRIIEDNSVGSDGTIVESVKNRIDCTIQNQINVIIDELFRELNFASEEKLVEEVEND